MCRRIGQQTLIPVIVLLASFAPQPAQAQDPIRLPGHLVAQQVDQWRLDYRQRRLHDDLERGDTTGANFDTKRIQKLEWRLWYERRLIRRDLFLPVGPWMPSPAARARQASLAAQTQYPNYAPPAAGPPQNSALPGTISVEVLNTASAGRAIDYWVNGESYRIEGGQRQRFDVGAGSQIAYDRGGGLGAQQYSLSPGVYEFRAGESGWALYKRRPIANDGAIAALPIQVPRNELPSTLPGPEPTK